MEIPTSAKGTNVERSLWKESNDPEGMTAPHLALYRPVGANSIGTTWRCSLLIFVTRITWDASEPARKTYFTIPQYPVSCA